MMDLKKKLFYFFNLNTIDKNWKKRKRNRNLHCTIVQCASRNTVAQTSLKWLRSITYRGRCKQKFPWVGGIIVVSKIDTGLAVNAKDGKLERNSFFWQLPYTTAWLDSKGSLPPLCRLDTDPVYERQWRMSRKSVAAIHDYLGKIKRRVTVIKVSRAQLD